MSIEVTTPNDLEIIVRRFFAAPPEIVFACHTRPELMQRWLIGPSGWSMPECEIDLRVGGQYRCLWREDATGAQFTATGEYLEIEAPHRLVNKEQMDGFDGASLCTLTLTPRDGGTDMIQTMRFSSKAVRDKALQTGMTEGMSASYDKLDAIVGTVTV